MASVQRLVALSAVALPLVALFVRPAGGAEVSPVVQVAVNYAPGKSTMISGVVVGEGDFVLTQASVLEGAREIAVALTNTDILEPVVERADRQLNIALLRLPQTVNAGFRPIAALPPGPITARVEGAPTAFEVGRSTVRLMPVKGARRWKIEPSVPLTFRGAPLVSISGTLLGIVVEQGGELTGVPIAELGDLLPGAPGGMPAAQPAPTVPSRDPEGAAVTPAEAPAAAAQLPVLASRDTPRRGTVTAVAQAPLPPAAAPQAAADADAEAALATAPAPAPELPPPPPELESPRTPGSNTLAPGSAFTPPEAPVLKPREASKPAQASASPPQSRASSQTPAGGVAAWEALIREQPRNANLRFSYANALMAAGQYGAAVQVLEQALRDFPSLPGVYWHLAHAYWQQALHKPDGSRRSSMERGAYYQSMAAFQRFIELAPNDPRANDARHRLQILKRAQYGSR